MASEKTILAAIRMLTAEGFTLSSPQTRTSSVASAPAQAASPRRRMTAEERSAAQPRVKHCSKCSQPGHNAATCGRRQEEAPAQQTPTVDMTAALLDGIPTPASPAPKRSRSRKGGTPALPPPPTLAEDALLF